MTKGANSQAPRVLFLVTDLFGRVGTVASPLIEALAGEFYVHVVTSRRSRQTPRVAILNGAAVRTVADRRSLIGELIERLDKWHGARALKYLTLTGLRIARRLSIQCHSQLEPKGQPDSWALPLKATIRICRKLSKEEAPRAVISVHSAFQAHAVAFDLMKFLPPSTKWFIIDFDTYAYRRLPPDNSPAEQRLLDAQRAVMDRADAIFLTPELHRFYLTTPLSEFRAKMIDLPFATIRKPRSEPPYRANPTNGPVRCLYLGEWYSDIRNPSYLLRLFEKSSHLHLVLVGAWGRERIEREVGFRLDERVSVERQVNENATEGCIWSADILISVGNTNAYPGAPSKVCQYISSGLPIVHFAKTESDPALQYLERYPLTHIVREYEECNDSVAEELQNWCLTHAGLRLPFADIQEKMGNLDGSIVQQRFASAVRELLNDYP